MGTTTFSVALLWASVALNPVDDTTVDEVDLIEVNHFHDEQGRLVFDQIIFYDWCPDKSRYQVRAWRMLKEQTQIPRRDVRGGGFVAVWHDSQNGDLLRKVRSQSLRETWTQYDPELVEREFLPKERRKELIRQPTKSPSAQAARQRMLTQQEVASNVP